MSDTIVSNTGMAPPFRAEHVGSLLRPAALLAARAEYEGGRITAGMLRETEDDCIRHAVVMQAELGLKGVTDGEFRRGSWHMDFLYQIGGVEKTDRHAAYRIQKRGRNGRILTGGAPRCRQATPRQDDFR